MILHGDGSGHHDRHVLVWNGDGFRSLVLTDKNRDGDGLRWSVLSSKPGTDIIVPRYNRDIEISQK